MTSHSSHSINAQKVIQNNQEFLLGVFTISEVKSFTRYTERLIVGYEEIEEENLDEGSIRIDPIYNKQVQRKTSQAKVEKIADFLINDPEALFPTNIVIAIPNQVIDSIREEGNTKQVTVVLNDIVKQEVQKTNGHVFLTIIDGQHRIRGIERAIERLEEEIKALNGVLRGNSGNNDLQLKLSNKQKLLSQILNFELVVSFFIDPTLEYQAMVFATINKTQTKVPENLVYSLFGLTTKDSPQKTALEIVLALNGIEKSPFYNRIRLVGAGYAKNESPPLSQATMVRSILFGISNNAREAENDRHKERYELKDNPKGLPFRKYYAHNDDRMILRIIYAYFSAVRNVFVDRNNNPYWTYQDRTKPQNILQTTVGFQALLMILFKILKDLAEDEKDQIQIYENYLRRANDVDIEDKEGRYPFTSKSKNIFYNDLGRKIWREEFEPKPE